MNKGRVHAIAGIWIDRQKALLFTQQETGWSVASFPSELEPKHRATGGRGKSLPYLHETGPYSAQHHAHHEAQRREAFFAEVIAAMPELDELLILGRGPSPALFHNAVLNALKQKCPRVTCMRSQELTPLQLLQKVQSFFGWKAPRKAMLIPGQMVQAL